jgi:hypothetical protein
MTAREYIKKYLYVTKDGVEDVHDSLGAVENVLIEFAKMHVKKALEAALEDSPHGSSTDIPTYEDMKFAILGAYPDSLIK